MKCRVILDKTREEEILIYAHQRNELINEIERMCQNNKKQLVGYLRGDIIKLDICDVYCFALQGGRLYAICENERYLIKSRLYNVEEMLDKNFIKINQSSIANINKITAEIIKLIIILKIPVHDDLLLSCYFQNSVCL